MSFFIFPLSLLVVQYSNEDVKGNADKSVSIFIIIQLNLKYLSIDRLECEIAKSVEKNGVE